MRCRTLRTRAALNANYAELRKLSNSDRFDFIAQHRGMFSRIGCSPEAVEKMRVDNGIYMVGDSRLNIAGLNTNTVPILAKAIIDAGVASFMNWMDQRSAAHGVVPLIQQINAQADEWRATELARARRMLAKGEPVEAVLEALSKGLTQKMLHGTLAELHTGDNAARAATAQTVTRLFLRESAAKSPRDPQA